MKMVDFNKFSYKKIEYDYEKNIIIDLINKLKMTDNVNEYIELIRKINSIQNLIEEMYDYADIKNMRDINNNYWCDEINYWNDYKPKFDALFIPFYEELINSKFKKELEQIVPDNFFRVALSQLNSLSNNNLELLKQESELKTKYRNLNKSKINFNGKEQTLNAVSGLFSDEDSKIRKKAHDAINNFYYEHKDEYQNILFDLIKIRNRIAKNTGYENYVQYSLVKLKRFGYNYDDIKLFRENIIKYIIPICKNMNELKKEELTLDVINYYDTIFFKKMPNLKVYGIDLLNELKNSFVKVDDELSKLFNLMLEKNYIDLCQNSGKVNFSITNYLVCLGMPVITGNFKNSYLDLQTTTHEMGHSFQKYCSSIEDKNYIISPLLKYPTMEIAEMFSYAMELIMMNKVSNIFSEDDYNKYQFIKIYNLISQLPYICAVDEFQEIIYSKEDLKLDEINKIWLKLSKKYHLEISNSGNKNLNDGGYYYRQSHIFLDPFYYIDYALSYFGAVSIWNSSKENLDLFKQIARVASYYSFKDLIEKYNMPNPFDSENVKIISSNLNDELSKKRILK